MRPARLLSVPTKSEWETLNTGGEIFRGNPPEMLSGAVERCAGAWRMKLGESCIVRWIRVRKNEKSVNLAKVRQHNCINKDFHLPYRLC